MARCACYLIPEIRALDGSFTLAWPVQTVAVRDGPDPDGSATLSLGRDPARLVTADPALLRQIAHAAGGRRRRRLRDGWRHHGAVTFVSALMGLAACALAVDQAPGLLAPLVPQAWADRLGAGVEAALTAGGAKRRCVSADGQGALDRLTGQLATAGGLGQPPRVVMLNDATVNALTLPGGRVLVLRGLVDAAEDGDELAGVLAHELGHVAHRDPLKALLRAAGLSAIGMALGWEGGAGNAASLARAVAGAAYGRAAEMQADAAAIAALRSAGLRADGLGRFFATLQRREAERSGARLPAWLSDHPPPADRAARVAQPADGTPAFTDAEWAAVRSMCRAS